MRLVGTTRGSRSWFTAGAVLLCSHYVTSQPTLRGGSVIGVVADSIKRDLSFAPLARNESSEDTMMIFSAVTSAIAVAACAAGIIAWFTYHHAPVMLLARPWLKHVLIRIFFVSLSALLAAFPQRACVASLTFFFLAAPGLLVTLGCVGIKSKVEERRALQNRARRAGGLKAKPARVSPKFMHIAVYSTDAVAIAFVGAFLIWEIDETADDNPNLCMHGGEDPNIPVAVLYGILGLASVFALVTTSRALGVLSIGYECFGNFVTMLSLLFLCAFRIADFASMSGVVLSSYSPMVNAVLCALAALTSLGLVLVRKLPYVHMSETEAKEAAVVAYGLGIGAVRRFPGGDGGRNVYKSDRRGSAATVYFDPTDDTSIDEDLEDAENRARSSSWVPEDGGKTVIDEVNLKYGYVLAEATTAGSARGMSPRGDRSKRFFDAPPSPQSPGATVSADPKTAAATEREHSASARIQAIVRGVSTRAKLHPVLWQQRNGPVTNQASHDDSESDNDDDEAPRVQRSESIAHKAATRIQAVFRGRKTRQWLRRTRDEFLAATRIQALFRGRVSRKRVEVIRRCSSAPTESSSELLYEAASPGSTSGTWAAARPTSIQTQGLDEIALENLAASRYAAGEPARHPAVAAAVAASPESPNRSSSFGSKLLSMRIPSVHLPKNPLRSPPSRHKRNQTL